jgi:hypothetical protein
MNPRPLELCDDPDLRLSLPAMRRAARRARELARQTRTCIVVGEQGKVLRISPDELDRIEAAGKIEAEQRLQACQAGEATATYRLDDVFHDDGQ